MAWSTRRPRRQRRQRRLRHRRPGPAGAVDPFSTGVLFGGWRELELRRALDAGLDLAVAAEHREHDAAVLRAAQGGAVIGDRLFLAEAIAIRRSAATPLPTRYATTASARRCDSPLL